MLLGSYGALESLASHLVIALCDSYGSFMLSNLLHVSLTEWMHTNHELIMLRGIQIIHELDLYIATPGHHRFA